VTGSLVSGHKFTIFDHYLVAVADIQQAHNYHRPLIVHNYCKTIVDDITQLKWQKSKGCQHMSPAI